MIKVSVIVPVYNMQQYVVETLQSILASDYTDYEIIIVDDGSRDHSAQVIEDFIKDYSSNSQNTPNTQTTLIPIKFFRQPNKGVSAARNYAISMSSGEYILPIDADDKISPDFLSLAADYLDRHSNTKVVGAEGEYFGAKTGKWKVAPFSLSLLARKNMIAVSSMFRRSDFDKTQGYNELFPVREDWDLWLSIFAQGGDFYRIPKACLYYRIRRQSKREDDSKQKQNLIRSINARHYSYMYKYLNGPLHYHRTWSRFFNFFRHESGKGQNWRMTENKFLNASQTIWQGRNTIKLTEYDEVIKSYQNPSFFKSLIYGLFVRSKAQRSYEYALRLQQTIGNITPQPIAYMDVRYCCWLNESYYACRKSDCRHTFNELINNPSFPNREQILNAIGRFTALLHDNGVWHEDYSGGNILFNDDGSHIEIIDLNRMKFLNHIGQEKGCRGFERLNIDRQALTLMAHSYAEARGFNKEQCAQDIIRMRWHKHIKQGITNL